METTFGSTDHPLERAKAQRRHGGVGVGLREVPAPARHGEQPVEVAFGKQLEQQLTAVGGHFIGAQASLQDEVQPLVQARTAQDRASGNVRDADPVQDALEPEPIDTLKQRMREQERPVHIIRTRRQGGDFGIVANRC